VRFFLRVLYILVCPHDGYRSFLHVQLPPAQVHIPVKYALFGNKIRVQDLLVEHVVNRHLA
jgi:hypothetical protein